MECARCRQFSLESIFEIVKNRASTKNDPRGRAGSSHQRRLCAMVTPTAGCVLNGLRAAAILGAISAVEAPPGSVLYHIP